ncbi:UNVERIFIED_CONTAM: hypothetical protein NCL1_32362 [Trichonephila clavipes]
MLEKYELILSNGDCNCVSDYTVTEKDHGKTLKQTIALLELAYEDQALSMKSVHKLFTRFRESVSDNPVVADRRPPSVTKTLRK